MRLLFILVVTVLLSVSLYGVQSAEVSFQASAVESFTATLTAPEFSNEVSIRIPIVFSDRVDRFHHLQHVSVTNGLVTGGHSGSGGTHYNVIVRPTAEGLVTVTIKENSVTSGTKSFAGAQITFTSDTTPPAAPSITNSTAIVTSAPVSIVGTAEANSVVELFHGGTSVGTVTADNSGNFSFSGLALYRGGNSFTATATDAAGNTSHTSSAVVITLNVRPTPGDTTSPAAPVISNPPVTVTSSPVTIEGTAENYSDVKLFNNGTSVGTAPTSSSGTFSFSGVVLSEGINTFTATATDVSDNTSLVSSPPVVITLNTPTFDGTIVGDHNVINYNGADYARSSPVQVKVTLPYLGDIDRNTDIDVTNGEFAVYHDRRTNSPVSGSMEIYLRVNPTADGIVTLTIPAGRITQGGEINTRISYSFIYDTTPPPAPVFSNSTTTVTSSPVSIVGTAEANSVVKLFNNGTSVGTTTTSGSGTFSFSGVILDKGANSFTATATDVANNTSPESSDVVITLNVLPIPGDTTPPAAPVFSNSTTTVISSPVTLEGTAENYSDVELFKDGTSVGTTTTSGSGTFSFSGVELAGSVNSFTATATDVSNNTSVASSAVIITLDITPPAAPVITSSTTTVTSSPVSIVGTAEANSDVELFKGETSLDTVTADNSGNFSFSNVVLSEGANSFTATATDAANNTSVASSPPVVITLDTTPPAAPVFSNSTTTVASSPVTLEGTAENYSVVELFKDGTSVGTTTTSGSGTFSFSGVILDKGANIFTVKAKDAVDNTSPASAAVVITLNVLPIPGDTTPPAAPVISNSTTTVTSFSVTIEGTAENYSDVKLFKDGTFVGTAPVSSSGTFSFSGVILDKGANTFTATATDLSDNTSLASSPPVVITLDTPTFDGTIVGDHNVINYNGADYATSSPVQVKVTLPYLGHIDRNTDIDVTNGEFAVYYDRRTNSPVSGSMEIYLRVNPTADGPVTLTVPTGRIAHGGEINTRISYSFIYDATPPPAPVISNSTATVTSSPVSIVGTAEANSVVELFRGTVSVANVTASGLGAFTFSSVALAEGANSFTATATDAANNKSVASPAVVITLDTTAPAAPVITNSTATVASSPVSIVGTAEANSVVELFKGETSLGTVTADNLGAFTFSSVALAEGDNSFTTTATDAANNKSPASLAVVITLNTPDTTPPAAPVITNTTSTVASSPVSIVGTAEANSVVELFKGETSLGTVTADNLGAFTFSSVALAEGDNSFTATATDAANNKSVASTPVVITLDTTAPAAPAISTTSDIVTQQPISIRGTAEANSTVELFNGGVSVASGTASNTGSFSFSNVALAEGDNSFTAKATDRVGNTSPASPAVVITLNTPDTTPPAAPVITNSTATVVSSPVSIVGTAEANSVVELFKGETSLGTVTADNLGAFTFSSVALAEGANSFTATATDAANNKSPASHQLLSLLLTLLHRQLLQLQIHLLRFHPLLSHLRVQQRPTLLLNCSRVKHLWVL